MVTVAVTMEVLVAVLVVIVVTSLQVLFLLYAFFFLFLYENSYKLVQLILGIAKLLVMNFSILEAKFPFTIISS